ncbi:MAG: FAD-dependent oxidoreductase [Oscillospiraceae bacterium]|nr:FAD-dependent oxidoreductase [Oscillospiraceae bacterium]
MNDFSHVLSPIRVAGHLLKNRIISGPSTIHTASNGEDHPTEAGKRFFVDRARAGAGLVTCAGVSIGGFNNDGVHASWDITIPNRQNALCDLADEIHMYGAKCTMELIGVLPDGWTVSDGCSIMGGPVGRGEAPLEVLDQFKAGYVQAAIALKASGFDGILFHFGHSIPIAQFLSPLTNKRTDQYGGSFENRVRYPIEILKACREAVGRDMIFDVRFSGSEFEKNGIDEAEGLKIAAAFQDYCDILQVSAGMHNPDWMTWTHPCGFLPPMPNVYLAENIKKSGKIDKAFISTIGGIGTLSDAEEIIASGKADFVVVARQFIADPNWIKKGLSGIEEDIVPCVKCMRCHDSDNYAQHMQCTVNPHVGMEEAVARIPESEGGKKVAIIGGGPAGMMAALTAADRGHYVTLFEKSDSLGGNLKFASYVSFKWPLRRYKDYLIAQIAKSAVDVRLGTEATPEMVADFDAVIAAVGAAPVVPPIPGVEKAIPACDSYGKEAQMGDSVVVIGGGQVGCETALHLAKLGKKVTIIEMQSALAPDASKTHRDEMMVEIGNEPNFIPVVNATVQSVADDGVTYKTGDETVTVPCTSVILAAGMRARIPLADSFMGITPDFAEIGDCVKARTVEWATKEGFYAAMNL